MPINNIISSATALARINERLRRPMSPQNFNQSIIPKMEDAGHAQVIGRRQSSIVDSDALERWIVYLAERERRIDAGEWIRDERYDDDSDSEDLRPEPVESDV